MDKRHAPFHNNNITIDDTTRNLVFSLQAIFFSFFPFHSGAEKQTNNIITQFCRWWWHRLFPLKKKKEKEKGLYTQWEWRKRISFLLWKTPHWGECAGHRRFYSQLHPPAFFFFFSYSLLATLILRPFKQVDNQNTKLSFFKKKIGCLLGCIRDSLYSASTKTDGWIIRMGGILDSDSTLKKWLFKKKPLFSCPLSDFWNISDDGFWKTPLQTDNNAE